MTDRKETRFDSIDLLLVGGIVVSTVTLLFALFPALWHSLVTAVDVRNWSRWTWLLANVVVVLILLSIRLAPEVKESVAARRAAAARRRKVAKRKQQAADREARLFRRIRRY